MFFIREDENPPEKNKKSLKKVLTYVNTHDIIMKSVGTRDNNRKTKARDHSSAGRAPALQAGGHRFEPCWSHSYRSRKI